MALLRRVLDSFRFLSGVRARYGSDVEIAFNDATRRLHLIRVTGAGGVTDLGVLNLDFLPAHTSWEAGEPAGTEQVVGVGSTTDPACTVNPLHRSRHLRCHLPDDVGNTGRANRWFPALLSTLPQCQFRFYFDPGGLTLANGHTGNPIQIYTSHQVWLQRTALGQLQAKMRIKATVDRQSAWIDIPDASYVQIDFWFDVTNEQSQGWINRAEVLALAATAGLVQPTTVYCGFEAGGGWSGSPDEHGDLDYDRFIIRPYKFGV